MSDVEPSGSYIMQENDEKQEIIYGTGDDSAIELEDVQLSESGQVEET